MAVSALIPIDSRSRPLPADEPRAVHYERLWAPGRAGAELSDWLGAGHFPGPVSNLFMRREFLRGLQLDAQTPNFAMAAVLLAALQSQLAVIDEPLLSHYPPAVEAEPSPRASADLLQTQMAVLTALREKLPVSPETRRNLASYHRAAWNSMSGVREDLFQQAVLRLASLAAEDEVRDATAEVLRARGPDGAGPLGRSPRGQRPSRRQRLRFGLAQDAGETPRCLGRERAAGKDRHRGPRIGMGALRGLVGRAQRAAHDGVGARGDGSGESGGDSPAPQAAAAEKG